MSFFENTFATLDSQVAFSMKKRLTGPCGRCCAEEEWNKKKKTTLNAKIFKKNTKHNQSEGVPSGIFGSLGALGKGLGQGSHVCLFACLFACLLVPGGSRAAGSF